MKAALFLVAFMAAAPSHADVPRHRLTGEVNGDTSVKAIHFIEEANENGATEILLEIDTPGGDVAAGFGIIRAIEESDAPVTCVVDGDADSMGFAILQSCDRRLMTKRSKLMAHEPALSAEVWGQPNQWQAIADMLEAEREILAEQCARRLHVSMDDYRARTDGGQMWFFTWKDALHYGAVDGLSTGAKAEAKKMAKGKPAKKWAAS